ncbi:MAG: hypothetical protein IPO85_00245 [Saprospiraceae bacterium]|uniref:Uncharacterized protein n=1 Tax=Candidatus Defluviibacterium haderslevense TaxID=2981993 RepID=A0A9D7S5V1_9BACT|nr:hypothetical protein [Candidatus Defluviibacterium haderslevense]
MKTSKYKVKIICAIYPNANGFGFVYLDNEGQLVYYGSVRINPISNWKVLERIKKSLDYFQPRIVILLDPESKSSRTGYRTKKLIKVYLPMLGQKISPSLNILVIKSEMCLRFEVLLPNMKLPSS